MKVLLLFEYASLNGGEHSMLCIVPLLQQQGVEFRAMVRSTGPLIEALNALGIDVTPLASHNETGQRLSQTELRANLRQRIQQSDTDLIHANSLSMARLAGPVADDLSLPSIGHLRDIVRLSKRAVADTNCNCRLVAVSAATRDWHVAQGLNAHKTFVAHNGVDLDQFQPRATSSKLRNQLGIDSKATLLGAVGQIGMRKGLDVLLAALSQIDLARHDIHLILAGERHSVKQEAIDFENELHRLASTPPLRDRVHFVGRVDDMPTFYNEIDMLIHAARQEPLGRVLLEAAACAVPIVATQVGGTEEIFPPASNSAWLVSPDDPTALAAAISEAIADEQATNMRGKRGRKIIERSFASELAALRILEVYESV